MRCGLQLLALTFVRPGELRHAEWREFRPKQNNPTDNDSAKMPTSKGVVQDYDCIVTGRTW